MRENKIIIYLSFLLLLLLLLNPLFPILFRAKSSVTVVRDNKKWTFMVYLDADNNLESYGHSDLNEMKAVGSDPNINIVVLWDGRGNGDGELYYVKAGSVDTFPVSDAGIADEPAMSDPDTLDSFLQWAITNYPADHYALSIWDHGSGIFRGSGEGELTKGFCNDEHGGGGEIELWELNDVLQNAKLAAGKKIDVVGFDVCSLGYVETHYQIIPYVDYGIASEASEPGDGWDYETPLAALAGDPNMASGDLASEIVSAYIDEYSSYITQSALDLSQLNHSFMPKLDDLSEKLTNYMYHYENQIKDARSDAQNCGRTNARDLYDFAKGIQQDGSLPAPLRNSATALLNEFGNTVIEEGQKSYPGAKGIMIYFPNDGPSSTYTSKIDMASSKWDEFLVEYNDPQLRYEMTIEVFDEDGDEHEDDVLITVKDFIGGVGDDSEIRIDGRLVGTTDGTGKLYYYNSSKGTHTVLGTNGGFEMFGQFTIANRPPIALAVLPDPVKAGEEVHFNSSLSSDPDDDLLSYMWNFGDGGGSAQANPDHVFEDDGVFTVSLIVIDTDSVESAPFSFDMVIENLPPIADAGEDVEAVEDETISFDGSMSFDTPADKAGILYQWDFGDDTVFDWTNSTFINHSYSNSDPVGISKVYIVELTVKDDDGITSTDIMNVTVSNVPPTANAGEESVALEDEVFTLSGANSTDTASDMNNLTYLWDLNESDGVNFTDHNGMIITCSFSDRGTYIATLRVIDDNGEYSDANVKIRIINVRPSAIMPYDNLSVSEDEIIYLNGSLSTDSTSDMETLYYAWEVDNGIELDGVVTNITFTDPGIYNITLTVTDDDGDFDTTTVSFNVTNVQPVARLADVGEVKEGEVVVFNASGSHDTQSDMRRLRYLWDLDYDGRDFSEDITNNSYMVEHTYTTSGERKVMMKVVDDNEAFDTTIITFSVLNVKPEAILNITSTTITTGDTLLFDGSLSNDSENDKNALKFTWFIDDLVVARGNRTFSHTFSKSGDYLVRLEVQDDDGAVDFIEIEITVNDPPDDALFSMRGIFIYIGAALLFFILIVFIVIGKRRKKRALPDDANDSIGEQPAAPQLSEEEKKREYERLYGKGAPERSGGKADKTTDRTYVAEDDNPFMLENDAPVKTKRDTAGIGKRNKDRFSEEEISVSEFLLKDEPVPIRAGKKGRSKKNEHSSRTKRLKALRAARKRSKGKKRPVASSKDNDKFSELIQLLDEVAVESELETLVPADEEEGDLPEEKMELEWEEDDSDKLKNITQDLDLWSL